MRPLNSRCFLLITLFLGAVPVAAADELQVNATLEPRLVSPQGFALLTIEISDAGLGGRVRALPSFEVENFETPNPPSRSESFEFRSGATRRSLSLIWRLRPLAEGPARVHQLRVQAGDRTIDLPELTATVDPAAPLPQPSRRPGSVFQSPFGSGDPFAELFGARPRRRSLTVVPPKVLLRASVKPERVVAGEQAVYSVHLYTQGDVSAIQPTNVPRFDRFWAREIPVPDRPRAEMVEFDGERYGEVTLLQRALFPLRAGNVRIEPFAADVAVRVASTDPLGGLLGEIETWRRESNAVDLTVDPLPTAPSGFSGAVGRLKFESALDRGEVELGEAATLTLALSGVGRLEGIAAPSLPPLHGVRVFPPQQEGGDQTQGTTVVGRRTWRYVLVPERTGQWTVAPVSITYFDPAQDAYRIASTEPRPLTAAAPTASEPAGTVADATTQTPSEESRRSDLAGAGIDWRAWLPWMLAAGLALALGLVLAQRRSRGGPASARVPEPDPEFRNRLELALNEERPRPMATAVENLFQSELVRRHALPDSTPAAQWAERLSHNGLSREVLDEIRALADELHYLRYAPQLAAIDSVRSDLAVRARRLAERL